MILKIALALIGATVGATMADVDLAPVGPWRHRSAWTHGPLLPLVMLAAAQANEWAWWFVVGALPTYALHLLADCFPRAWRGNALVKLYPLPWSLPAPVSFVYLASGVWASAKTFLMLVSLETLIEFFRRWL